MRYNNASQTPYLIVYSSKVQNIVHHFNILHYVEYVVCKLPYLACMYSHYLNQSLILVCNAIYWFTINKLNNFTCIIPQGERVFKHKQCTIVGVENVKS